jgi:hypothetical protein
VAEGARLEQTDSCGSTPVYTDVTSIGGAVAVRVVIGGTDYVATSPPGFPDRPANTGAAIREGGTVTFSAGGTYALLSAEATALIAAGFATLA